MKFHIPHPTFLLVLVLLGLTVFSLVSAQGIVPCGRSDQIGPDGQVIECELPNLILLLVRVINFFLGVSWLVAMFFMFWGSYNMVSAWGNEEKLTVAKTTFKNAVIGFFLILVSYLLVNFVVLALSGEKWTLNFNPTEPGQQSIFKLFPYP